MYIESVILHQWKIWKRGACCCHLVYTLFLSVTWFFTNGDSSNFLSNLSWTQTICFMAECSNRYCSLNMSCGPRFHRDLFQNIYNVYSSHLCEKWTIIWAFRLDFWLNPFPHTWHDQGCSPVCSNWCLFRTARVEKYLWQVRHWKFPFLLFSTDESENIKGVNYVNCTDFIYF